MANRYGVFSKKKNNLSASRSAWLDLKEYINDEYGTYRPRTDIWNVRRSHIFTKASERLNSKIL